MRTELQYLLKHSIAMFMVVVFLIASYFNASNIFLTGDTERYYQYYNSLEQEPFPFKLEFVVNLVMHAAKLCGGDFSFFVFLVFALWIGVVYWLSLKSLVSPFFFIILLFFFTPYFFDNAVFLVRQYICVVFFVYYIFSESKFSRFVFSILSLGGHSFFIYLWLISRRKISRLLFSPLFRVVGGVILVSVLFLQVDVGGGILQALYKAFGGVYWAVDRKLIGMMELMGEQDYFLSDIVVVINAVVLLAFVFRGGAIFYEAPEIRAVLSVCLFSSFVFFLFLYLPVLANRVAFVTYFLSIPSLLFCLYFLGGKIGFKAIVGRGLS